MKKTSNQDIVKIILLILITIFLIIRIILSPFLGNPFRKIELAIKTYFYLENKYENDDFMIKSINYDYKHGSVYYAIVKSKKHDTIGSFRVNYYETDEGMLLKDDLQEKILSTAVENFYIQLGNEFGYYDMQVSYSPLGNQLTLTVPKDYSKKDLAVMFSFIKHVKNDSIDHLQFSFKGSSITTIFVFTPEQLNRINKTTDIFEVCSPIQF